MGPAGVTWIYKDAAYTAADGEGILADTSGGAWSLTLPAGPSAGDKVGVSDYAGAFDTDNLTILRNGSLIHGEAEDLVVDLKDASFLLIYTGAVTGWKLDTYLTQGSTGSAGFAKISQYADVKTTSGGGIIAAKWYARRFNKVVTDDLSALIELVEYPIVSFSAHATAGSFDVAGDVSALFPSGRPVCIRNPTRDKNDDTAVVPPRIVASAAYGGVNTTITLQATNATYRTGVIVDDAAGTSVLTSSLIKCLSTGEYLIRAQGNMFGVGASALRLVNVSGFSYDGYAGVTADGGTLWTPGMLGYANTVPGTALLEMVVSLVAGEYYEIQQWMNAAEATNGLGYSPGSLAEDIWHCNIVISEY
ncbi:MAG: hypothetical protein WC381_11360 [Kiritimatiellia bacterium]|jgi:hypothetical protein